VLSSDEKAGVGMKIIEQKRKEAILLQLNGSLDIYTSIEFKEFLEKTVQSHPRAILVDLGKTDYVDSSGIGTLIKGLNLAKENKIEFYIINVQSAIEKVFRVAGLLNFFKILANDEVNQQFPTD